MRKCGNKKCCGSFSAFAKCGMGTRKRSRSWNRTYLEWVNLIWNQTKHASHLVSIQSWEMGSSAYWTKYARRTSQLNLGKTNWNKYFLPEPQVLLFTQRFYFWVDKQSTNLLAQHLLLDHMTECSFPSVFRTICILKSNVLILFMLCQNFVIWKEFKYCSPQKSNNKGCSKKGKLLKGEVRMFLWPFCIKKLPHSAGLAILLNSWV